MVEMWVICCDNTGDFASLIAGAKGAMAGLASVVKFVMRFVVSFSNVHLVLSIMVRVIKCVISVAGCPIIILLALATFLLLNIHQVDMLPDARFRVVNEQVNAIDFDTTIPCDEREHDALQLEIDIFPARNR